MKKLLSYAFLTLVFCSYTEEWNPIYSNKKNHTETKKTTDNPIGFACYYTGSPSEIVKEFERLINDTNYMK